MTATSESPANSARQALIDTLAERIPDLGRRIEIIDLAFEEIDQQLSEPDDVMIVAGQEVLDAAGGAQILTLFFRRKLVEQIWRTMAEKAFGR